MFKLLLQVLLSNLHEFATSPVDSEYNITIPYSVNSIMSIRYGTILLVAGLSLAAAGSSSTFHKKRSINLNGVRLKFAATHCKQKYFSSYYSKKKLDGSSRFVIATYERMKSTDFAFFMWAEPLAMVVPRPGEEPRIFAFVHPFQSTVWLLTFIAGFTVVVFMTMFSGIYWNFFLFLDPHDASLTKNFTIYGRFTYYMIYMINTVTSQGNAISLRRLSFRTLVGVWVLVATVLVNSYSSTVTSYLTVPKMKPSINTFEDLVASENVELILLADTMTKKQILDATHGAQKYLGDDIRTHPDRILSSIEKVNVRLKTERYAFPNPQSFCDNFVASQFQEKGNCRFETTDTYSMTMFFSMPLQKNSKYTPIFKDAFMELWETGLPLYWVKNSIPRAPKCFEKTNLRKSAIPKPIRLDDLAGAFLILGVGVGLATFFFLMENIILATSAAVEKYLI